MGAVGDMDLLGSGFKMNTGNVMLEAELEDWCNFGLGDKN